ncbi:hypothetical protein V2W45_1520956 [Cenococcum geophilum]
MAKKGLLEAIGIGAALSAVAGAYTFSEFAVRAKKLHEVASENEVFIDLAETERLLYLPSISRYTRRVSGDLKYGYYVGIRYRFRWVLNNYKKLSLIQVLSFLSTLEPLAYYKESLREDRSFNLPNLKTLPIRANWLISRL